jgi:HK97 gp10 family phage protein
MATIQQCNRALKRLPDFARAESQRAIDVTAFQIARLASAKARRLTGRLQTSITWKSRPAYLFAVVLVDSEAFYWKYHEYGTVKMGSQPVFRPAAEAVGPDHDQRMLQGLEKSLTQMEREAL